MIRERDKHIQQLQQHVRKQQAATATLLASPCPYSLEPGSVVLRLPHSRVDGSLPTQRSVKLLKDGLPRSLLLSRRRESINLSTDGTPASMLGVPVSSAINNMFCCYYYVRVMRIKCTLNSNTLSMFHLDDPYIISRPFTSHERMNTCSGP
jgi:hypothetical protein